MSVDLTYDILRAIAFELNMGYSFEETLMDLNISKESTPAYNINVFFADGSVRTVENEKINTYSTERKYFWLRSKSGRSADAIRIDFIPSDIIVDIDRSEMTIDPEKVDRYVDEDYFDLDKEDEKARHEALCNTPIVKISFVRNLANEFAYKYLV